MLKTDTHNCFLSALSTNIHRWNDTTDWKLPLRQIIDYKIGRELLYIFKWLFTSNVAELKLYAKTLATCQYTTFHDYN